MKKAWNARVKKRMFKVGLGDDVRLDAFLYSSQKTIIQSGLDRMKSRRLVRQAEPTLYVISIKQITWTGLIMTS